MEIIYLIIGLIVGFIIGWLVLKAKYASTVTQAEADDLKNRLVQVQSDKARVEEREIVLKETVKKNADELDKERGKVVALSASVSRMEETNNNLKERLTEQKAEIEELQEKFNKEFENLANRIFEEKGKKFTEENKERLGEILNRHL